MIQREGGIGEREGEKGEREGGEGEGGSDYAMLSHILMTVPQDVRAITPCPAYTLTQARPQATHTHSANSYGSTFSG